MAAPELTGWLAGHGGLVLALLAAGLLVGFLSGLLGIGGGGILVPVLYETFGMLGIDPAIRMHLTLGTSLAVIAPTTLKSFTGHRARGAVDLEALKRLGPPLVVGVVLGVVMARRSSGTALQWVWVVFGSLMALKMALGRDDWRLGEKLPGSRLVELYAVLVGFVSTLMSVGGAVFMVTLMTLYGTPLLRAVATSSGFGPMVSIPGTIGFIWAGWGSAGLPPLSLGFVNLLGAALILPASLLATSYGVRAAHGIPKRALELCFAAFLGLVVLRFLVILLG